MSLFRKPKKIQRRVFSSTLDDDEDTNGTNDVGGCMRDMDEDLVPPPPPAISFSKKSVRKDKSKDNKQKSNKIFDAGAEGKSTNSKALLSFADDEEDSEVFQVRKSSQSKKMMRMLDKERRKKKRTERDDGNMEMEADENWRSSDATYLGSTSSERSSTTAGSKCNKNTTTSTSSSSKTTSSGSVSIDCNKSKKSDSIQTEIRTDDFVLVVKKSESDLILNGRDAVCAGRDDLSDEEFEYKTSSDIDEHDRRHRFSKPEHLKKMLESGSIPDAAMIHAARKRRQKAREQSDFIPVEEPKEVPKRGSRLAREDVEGENSDDEERVDMNAISGVKELEERREQFYSVEHDSSDEDSDLETNDWEAQQIRKGVTGAQLVTAQQESVLSRFIIKSVAGGAVDYGKTPQSTFTLLEQAYAKSSLEKPQQLLATTKPKKDKTKMQTLRSPPEIKHAISMRLTKLKELNSQHTADIERITNELKLLQLEQMDCTQNAPTAAAKYRFYQEVKCYVADLIDCLNEKTATINDLEKLTMQTISKHQISLIERRRQDVRDQAKEMAEALKPSSSRRIADNEEHVRRAEREGRRTRRRCEREKNDMLAAHLDGMSSDDEISDHYLEQYKSTLEQLMRDANEIFADVNDEFCKVELILMKFYAWRKTDMESYKDAFVSLCLPKCLGPLIRLEMLTWSPLHEDYKDIEKMNWYAACMLYAWGEEETEESLKLDPDVNLVPTIIEKIILPKLTEIVNLCWDPLSTTQTLRLIGCISRLGRDFPLKETTKSMQNLFSTILDKMKAALENDVFIPIFPKQVQEAKTSFFQRQFSSGLKLFRNILSWQGIVADKPLRELAIASLLNRYLLMAMRVCTANDALSKAYVVVNTLPTAWLQPESETLQTLKLFIMFIKQTLETCDTKNPLNMQSLERAKQILQRLHSYNN